MKRFVTFSIIVLLLMTSLVFSYEKGPIAAPARPITSIYTAGNTQEYEIGTRYTTADGRVFRYARAYGTLNTDLLAQTVAAQHVSYTTVAASSAVGATSITINVAAGDGAGGNGAIAKDELKGGYLIVFPHSENSMNRYITGNTATAANGGKMTITVDEPLNVATDVNVTHAECMASPYLQVKASTAGDLYRGFVGLPAAPATTGQYVWLQTWGPCWVAPDNGWSSVDVGNTRENHQVVARYNGSIAVHDYADTENKFQQHIGFVLSHAPNGTQGAPFIMLQISP